MVRSSRLRRCDAFHSHIVRQDQCGDSWLQRQRKLAEDLEAAAEDDITGAFPHRTKPEGGVAPSAVCKDGSRSFRL